jgi:cytidylate kinase
LEFTMPDTPEPIDAVAIDGPAGAGKSTVARAVARRLGFLYVDTGAMYRAVALAAVRRGVDLEDPEAMGRVAESIDLAFDATGERIAVDGEDVTAAIRTPDLTKKIRYAAGAEPVRRALVRDQQAIAETQPVVMEGRDITTVVLPHARWRFYLDASVECRARRRLRDLEAAGHAASFEELAAGIAERDRSDTERAVGPLRRTGEQIYLDTSAMTQAEVIDRVVGIVDGGRP